MVKETIAEPTVAELTVEVVYASESTQFVKILKVPVGTKVIDAIELSGVYQQYSDLERLKIGIYGKIVEAQTVLQPLDRIEIYRPLLVEPKEARRLRAQKKQQEKKEEQNQDKKGGRTSASLKNG